MTRRTSALILGCVALGALAGCSGNTTGAAGDPPAANQSSSTHVTASAGTQAEASPKSSAGADTKESGARSTKQDAASGHGKSTKKASAAKDEKQGSGAKDHNAATGSTDESAMTASSVLDRLPSPAGSCPAVGSDRDVRSGSMAAGPFDAARAQFSSSKPTSPEATKVRLYWIPKSGKTSAHGLVLKVTKVGSNGTVNTVRDAVVADAGGVSFYDSQVPIPGPGTWQIKATSGSDTGCFQVTFTK